MLKQMISAMCMFFALTIITGVVYPLAITGFAQILMPFQANGSIVMKNGESVGSQLIGQNFSSPAYFHGRPSVAGKDGYDATSSGGSNLGPTNAQLIDNIKERANVVRLENNLPTDAVVPIDLVTASGSGLDSNISPTAAYLQIGRIAKERGITTDILRKLVEDNIKGRQLGIFGEMRVNVLELNLMLNNLK